MKAFLALKTRKSLSEEVAFTNSDFLHFGFLNLVNSEFLGLSKFGFLAKFSMVDRYSTFLLMPLLLSALSIPLNVF